MKKNIVITVTILFAYTYTKAQSPYTATIDNNVTIFNGIITKYALENTKAFDVWYLPNQKPYTATAEVVTAMEKSVDKVKFIVFGGTWCEDTQAILPKFFKLQTVSNIPDKNISFFAVDRQKKIIGNLTDAFNITNVPTIIVMKDGKEIGRVVEYGKTGKWDVELAELVTKAMGQ